MLRSAGEKLMFGTEFDVSAKAASAAKVVRNSAASLFIAFLRLKIDETWFERGRRSDSAATRK
jgi:hypothetical protein